jgi:2-polyprenyl-3-methyl-5-hydroxy-6-metoxy-1,4-benzoquinol methylase
MIEQINQRPEVFGHYTARDLWDDDYISEKMLAFHLNAETDVSSRNRSFIERSVKWIVSHFNLQKGSMVADFGCGPGLYTERLAQHGCDVTGIDFSHRSIEYAKNSADKNGLSINYVNQNYISFETEERFDLILMIMCDFCALSPEQRRTILSKFSRLLKPQGKVFFDVYSLVGYNERQEESRHEVNLLDGFWSPDRYDGFLNVFKYDKEKVILDKYTILQNNKTRVIYNWLQYFSPESLREEVKETGFVIKNIFADVAGSPFKADGKEFAVVVRK